MDLYNDFTYFLENPGYGDEFHQEDRRIITGAKASYTLLGNLFGGAMDNTWGVQIRNDNAPTVGLFSVDEDQYVQTEVNDHVAITNVAPYFQNRVQWLPKLRSVLGLRWDFFNWDVIANIPQNSANIAANIGSPKAQRDLWALGQDRVLPECGRGIPLQRHPELDGADRSPIRHAPTPGRAAGAGDRRRGWSPFGHRSAPPERADLLVSAPGVGADFDGDHGVTVPSYPSNRYGVESANYYTPVSWLTFDADIAYSVPRFVGCPSSGPCDPAGT